MTTLQHRIIGHELPGTRATSGAYHPVIARIGAENRGLAPESVTRRPPRKVGPPSRPPIGYPASQVRTA